MKKYLLLLVLAVLALPAHAVTITHGYTFGSTEQVTAAKLHALVDSATISSITTADIMDGTITGTDIASNTITSGNILDGTITASDIASRTLTSSLYSSNSVDTAAITTNLIFKAGTVLNFSNNVVSLVFSNDQVAANAVVGTTNSAGAADAGKVAKLGPTGVLSSSMYTASPFSASFTSTNIVLTAAGTTTQTHGLGGMPTLLQQRLVNTSGELGYTAGDEVMIAFGDNNGYNVNQGFSVVPTASTIVIRFGSGASITYIVNKTTGAPAAIDPTKWQYVIRAWR